MGRFRLEEGVAWLWGWRGGRVGDVPERRGEAVVLPCCRLRKTQTYCESNLYVSSELQALITLGGRRAADLVMCYRVWRRNTNLAPSLLLPCISKGGGLACAAGAIIEAQWVSGGGKTANTFLAADVAKQSKQRLAHVRYCVIVSLGGGYHRSGPLAAVAHLHVILAKKHGGLDGDGSRLSAMIDWFFRCRSFSSSSAYVTLSCSLCIDASLVRNLHPSHRDDSPDCMV